MTRSFFIHGGFGGDSSGGFGGGGGPGGGPGAQTFRVPSSGKPFEDPQAALTSVLLHTVSVFFTPMVLYSFFPDSHDGPLRFGLDNRDVMGGMLLSGILLGCFALFYSMAFGASVASSHAAIYGAAIAVVVRLVLGKTSYMKPVDAAAAAASSAASTSMDGGNL